MPNIKYRSKLYLITLDKKTGDWIERIDIPAQSFEVDGGAIRRINISSADEISISSEFEQARAFKNITFFIPPTKDFLAVKLIELGNNGVSAPFEMAFVIDIYSGKLNTQTLRLATAFAYMKQTPIPVGNTPPLLMIKIYFTLPPQILHGKFDSKRKKIVHREI